MTKQWILNKLVFCLCIPCGHAQKGGMPQLQLSHINPQGGPLTSTTQLISMVRICGGAFQPACTHLQAGTKSHGFQD